MGNRSELAHVEVMVHRVSERAVLVSDDGDPEAAVWLPMSLIVLEEEPIPGRAQIVALPEWLAIAKGLV